jgi:hypothetical protein
MVKTVFLAPQVLKPRVVSLVDRGYLAEQRGLPLWPVGNSKALHINCLP